jgi:glycosyltransferase involved in cell wall biosynthesis
MISVILPTLDNEATLGDALADLVRAAVDGLVREVVAVDAGSRDATLEILEDAGARTITASGALGERLAVGVQAAKGAWLMVLPPRPVLFPGWERHVAVHLERHAQASAALEPERPGLFRRPSPDALLISRLRHDCAGGFKATDKSVGALLRRAGQPQRRLPILISDPGGRR